MISYFAVDNTAYKIAQAQTLRDEADQLQQQAAQLEAQATQLLANAAQSRTEATNLRTQAEELISQAKIAEVLAEEYRQLAQNPPITQGTVIYLYDMNGLLIAEYDNATNLVMEYLYIDGQPLALTDNQNKVYYYVNDHLGTPQKMMDQSQTVVWTADYLPFGETVINEDPDSDTNLVTNNIRMPGQYYDAETGFHYNYFRYYDPSVGRYITSDPIGLLGGLNLYSYANQNPINATDPLGLYCVWFQETGRYACYDPGTGTGEPYAEGESYSGQLPCVNRAACEHIPNYGPIPKGCYRVSGKPGDARRNLIPMEGTDMQGRSGFQIHGDNPNKPPQSSSEGCPIINKGDRNQIPENEVFCVF